MNKILSDFSYFPKQKELNLTIEEKELYSYETLCYLSDKEFDKKIKKIGER